MPRKVLWNLKANWWPLFFEPRFQPNHKQKLQWDFYASANSKKHFGLAPTLSWKALSFSTNPFQSAIGFFVYASFHLLDFGGNLRLEFLVLKKRFNNGDISALWREAGKGVGGKNP